MRFQLLGRIAIATVLFAFNASAAAFGGAGAGFNILDPPSPAQSSDIFVAGAANSIDSVQVTLTGITHTWVGDLQVTLTGAGQTIDLFSCTGSVGCVGAGDSTDLGGNLNGDYLFSDVGGADWWATAAGLGGAESMPDGTYAPTDDTNSVQSFFGTFGGLNPNGTWTLSIFDRAGGDTGALTSWTLSGEASTVNGQVPEPGTVILLGIGLLGFAAYRRRRV